LGQEKNCKEIMGKTSENETNWGKGFGLRMGQIIGHKRNQKLNGPHERTIKKERVAKKKIL